MLTASFLLQEAYAAQAASGRAYMNINDPFAENRKNISMRMENFINILRPSFFWCIVVHDWDFHIKPVNMWMYPSRHLNVYIGIMR